MKRSLLILMLAAISFSTSNAQISFSGESQRASALSNFSSIPLCFTENRGQWDSPALYKAEAGGATFWFCHDEIVYQFMRNTNELDESPYPELSGFQNGMPGKFNHLRYKKESMVITAKLVGANSVAVIEGEDRLSYNNNYFIGNIPSKWATDVPNYTSVIYKNIYPGIDLKYHGDRRGMKYDFIVNPGADISKIKIKYEGINNLSISNNGDLESATSFGPVYEKIPAVYQEISGAKQKVEGRYKSLEPRVFGFEVDNYNPAYPLIIDPELVYSTYLGGGGDDQANDVFIDLMGNIYVTGQTDSGDFPVYNPYDPNYHYRLDIFVAKFHNSDPPNPIYLTYLGGTETDMGFGVAADNKCSAYVTGRTASSDFPLIVPIDSTLGNWDIFVTKLSSSGNSIIFSTFVGGRESFDCGEAIMLDRQDNIYVTGVSYGDLSFGHDFPCIHAYDSTFNGGSSDVILFKMASSGRNLIYSTYLGGSVDDEEGTAIAVNANGEAYITGSTMSPNFPLVQPFDSSFSAIADIFIARFSGGGDSLLYSTFFSNSCGVRSYGIALDNQNNIFITGLAPSTGSIPIRNAFQPNYGGWGGDGFVAKLSANGRQLLFSTYLGGSGYDYASDIAVDVAGDVYITGYAGSINFPLVNPYQSNYPGGGEAFVTELNSSGRSCIYSTFLGGTGHDEPFSIAVGPNFEAAIAGMTGSGDFPLINPFDCTITGLWEGFVSKFDSYVDIDYDESLIPVDLVLGQNYPNPFNSQTTIAYSIPKKSEVALDIFDILGRKIANFPEGIKEPGSYQFVWDASGVSSGIYFYRLRAADFQETKRMTLVK